MRQADRRAIRRFRRVAFLAVLTVALIGLPALAAGKATSTSSEPSIRGVAPEELALREQELHLWLSSELPLGASDSPLRVSVTAEDRRALQAPPDRQPAPYKVGLVKPVGRRIDLGRWAPDPIPHSPLRLPEGVIRRTDDGGFVWAQAIEAKGAAAIRVQIRGMDLPDDADLYFFSKAGEAKGPYQRSGRNGDGEFWTQSLAGSAGVLVLRHFGPAAEADLGRIVFQIAAVGYIDKRWPGKQLPTATEALCSYNAECVSSGSSGAVSPKAIAYMEWIQGAWIYSCTGGLLADTDPGTEIPYFLTANHCLNKSSSNLELFWDYTSGCSGPSGPSSMGATILVTGRKGDFSLFRLDQTPPGTRTYMGWNNTPVAFATGTALHRLSHPSGAPQAYSKHSVDPNFGSCTGWPIGERIYSQDVSGATEGGSSGSPVVNGSGQVVGQLSGACGYDLADVCNFRDNRTVDGALAFYWDNVSGYLDPGTSCTPSTEVCDDGVDNDCDTQVDCADSDCNGDPACGGGGCTAGQPGDPCNSDGDCCSNKCKGPPSGRTCR